MNFQQQKINKQQKLYGIFTYQIEYQNEDGDFLEYVTFWITKPSSRNYRERTSRAYVNMFVGSTNTNLEEYEYMGYLDFNSKKFITENDDEDVLITEISKKIIKNLNVQTLTFNIEKINKNGKLLRPSVQCSNCYLTLTHPDSLNAGMGPKCRDDENSKNNRYDYTDGFVVKEVEEEEDSESEEESAEEDESESEEVEEDSEANVPINVPIGFKNEINFEKGMLAMYNKTKKIGCRILDVHKDKNETYYTIQLINGRELQTIDKYLETINNEESDEELEELEESDDEELDSEEDPYFDEQVYLMRIEKLDQLIDRYDDGYITKDEFKILKKEIFRKSK